jgi:hypothetical protein
MDRYVILPIAALDDALANKGDYSLLDLWGKRFYCWLRQGVTVLCLLVFEPQIVVVTDMGK